MVEKNIRGGMCHTILQYVKPNNKYIKDYDPNKELHISCPGMSASCMNGRCHNSSLWMVSNRQKNLFRFDKVFMQNYNDDSDRRYILEVDVYPKELQKRTQ